VKPGPTKLFEDILVETYWKNKCHKVCFQIGKIDVSKEPTILLPRLADETRAILNKQPLGECIWKERYNLVSYNDDPNFVVTQK